VRISFLSFLWILPFFCFLGGYQLVRFFSDHGIIEAPAVVGQHIHDAIKLLSQYHLNARILTEKEDNDLPEGIVLSQSPPQGQKVKAHQSVFLVVTRKPPQLQAPSLYGMTLNEATTAAQAQGVQLKAYGVESVSPQGTSIAQNAHPQDQLIDGTLTAYFSEGTTPIRVFPDLKGKKVSQVVAFLKEYGIQAKLTHTQEIEEHHTCSFCTVLAQRPLAGALISLKRPLTVQLTVHD
jgi:eukaryotic-like serine/threonine-protein kinase